MHTPGHIDIYNNIHMHTLTYTCIHWHTHACTAWRWRGALDVCGSDWMCVVVKAQRSVLVPFGCTTVWCGMSCVTHEMYVMCDTWHVSTFGYTLWYVYWDVYVGYISIPTYTHIQSNKGHCMWVVVEAQRSVLVTFGCIYIYIYIHRDRIVLGFICWVCMYTYVCTGRRGSCDVYRSWSTAQCACDFFSST